MPLPSFGFGHRPSWEHERPDASGAALEEPQPQPARTGWRGKVAIVTGGATGLGRHIAIEFGARTGIRRLVAADVLSLDREARVRFRHALTREAVARSTPASLQRVIHLSAFEYYREATTLVEEHRMTQLAYHAAGAGRSVGRQIRRASE
jgi:NAD(P)-dependent dehydrogenase (short-subunit alcohol dehydrogenase family)